MLFLSLLMLCVYACKPDPPKPNENEQYPEVDWELLSTETTPFVLKAPITLPDPRRYVPADNPMTVEGIALGRKLFYDPILSADSTMACVSCHQQDASFTDKDNALSVGVANLEGKRNSMPLFNLVYADRFFWDGRSASLEEQALLPVEAHDELNLKWEDAVDRLMRQKEYRIDFYTAYGIKDISKEYVAKALAQFERTMISGSSPFDKSVTPGSASTLEDDAWDGYDLFFTEGGDCFHCHGTENDSSNLFTFHKYSNNGLTYTETLDGFPDKGLGDVTGNPSDNGLFKVPSLRNLAFTAPYMHDGRFQTIDEVLDHYSEGIEFSPNLDPVIATKFRNGLRLTDKQKRQIKAFLLSLSDEEFLENENFKNPF